jgi:CRP-like cAMP-binding protein
MNIDQELEEVRKSLVSSAYNTEEEKDFFAKNIQVKIVKKGELLLKEGQFIKASYHLFKGCIREHYLKDGEERTVGFYTAGESLSGDGNSAQLVPSRVTWECVTDSIVSVFTFEVEKEMFQKFPRLESMCRTETEKQYANYKTEVNHYLASTPEERYDNLLKEKPEIFQFVPLYHIASYLGVKPESLSRIRNRMRYGR